MRHALSRRQLLASTGMATAGLALSASGLRAQSLSCSEAAVGTWGGDYQELLIANFEKAVLGPLKVEVNHDVANAPPRKTKLLTERTARKGTMDVALLSEIDMFEMYKAGVLEELDYSRLKNGANIIPALRRTYSIPHIYSGKIILYNPTKVTTPPTSYADLWDPKYKGRVGFADGLYIQIIESAAMIAGGSLENFEPAKAKLAELKKLDAKVYPSNEALAAALKSEEVWFTIMWRARGVQWKNAGIPVAPAIPKEGVTPIIFEAAIPKNAPNKDCAYAYLDAMLDPRGQVGFAAKMGYVPTVTNAPLDAKLTADLSFTAEEQKKFLIPNLEYVAKNNAALLDWWNREFKG